MGELAPEIPPEVKIPKSKEGFHGLEGGKKDKKSAAGGGKRRLVWEIPAGVLAFSVAATGVGIALGESKKLGPLQDEYENIKASMGIKDRISYDKDGTPVVDLTETTQTPETTSPQTTETPTTQEKIKKFEGLKIELVSDPSLSKLKLQRGDQIFTPKEAVYADPVEGPKKLENALLVTWALTLKEREKHLAFENVDKGDQEALISALRGLLDQGEIPTFTLQLENDWSIAADEAKTSKTETYKVDMTKGVKLVFVGEVTNLVENVGTAVDSRDFIVFTHTPDDFQPAYALRYEVAEDNSLIIKIFDVTSSDKSFCAGIVESLQRIILNETQRINVINWKFNSVICDNLFDGNQWDKNGKWTKEGKPVIIRNGDYSQN